MSVCWCFLYKMEIFIHCFFQYPIRPSFGGDINCMYVRFLAIVPWITEALLIFFSLFSLPLLRWIIFINRYLCLPIFSSEISNPFLSSSAFLMEVLLCAVLEFGFGSFSDLPGFIFKFRLLVLYTFPTLYQQFPCLSIGKWLSSSASQFSHL